MRQSESRAGSGRRCGFRLPVPLLCLVLACLVPALPGAPARSGSGPGPDTAAPAGAAAGPRRILVVGDSLAAGLAAGMAGLLSPRRSGGPPAATVERLVNIGAGAIPRNGFDFAAALERRLGDRARPVDLVVMTLGLNDVGMPLGRGPFYGEDWARLYRERLAALIAAPAGRSIPTFWVGPPAIGNRRFAEPMERHILPLQEAVLAAPGSGAAFIPIAAVTAADGAVAAEAFPRPRPRRFRAEDGVHFTGEGYAYVAAYVLAEIERVMQVRLTPGRD